MTARLALIPLTDEQLALAVSNWQALEAALELAPSAYTLSPAERRAIKSKRRKLAADPERLHWYTYWLLVERQTANAVGMCGFKGAPVAGEVEVGYGTFPRYRRQGYMTEALAGLLAWARSERPGLRILAETAQHNGPSQRVLEKAGFVHLPERKTGTTIWWVYG